MINQVFSVTPTKTRPVQLPVAVNTPGMPLLIGKTPFTNLDAYQQIVGGATGYFDGCYAFTVEAFSTPSPLTGKTINIGDPIYATGGTLDATTNVTSGIVLGADSVDGVLFGYLDASNAGPLLSGTTAVVNVSLANEI